MTIKTYGLSFMSRWQSALNTVLQRDVGGNNNLSADHPAMKASCTACETLETALKEGREGVDLADVVTKGELVTNCAHMVIALAFARFTGNTQRARILESQLRYSVCDPLWAKALLHFDDDHASTPYRQYQTLDDFVLPINGTQSDAVASVGSETCKIVFVSDWGTGTPLARNVMRCIADQQPDIVIHLGDVYYSGTKQEMQDHFLTIVRDCLAPHTRVFNLAGNHDLYAGGAGSAARR